MKYLSLCSGIEAATVAWHPLGWEAVAYSEIEKFPSQVLAHHYPQTPNLGDMTKFKEWSIESNVDLLVGGTPCQSFSVAGLRKGLDDPRGNLMLTYLAIADKYRPRWLVWENVPGVLSSNGGQDFGVFLGALGELGYGFAYRILDAQYFGVAQRRRRVFVVGYLGDWRPAAAVLFERHSLSGNSAPSREKRQAVAGTIASRFGISRNNHEECVTWPAEISSTLDTTFGTKQGLENQHVNAGCPMFVPAHTFSTPAIGHIVNDEISSTITKNTGAGGETQNPAYVMQPIAYNITFCDANGTRSDRPNGGLYVSETDVTSTLTKAGIGTNVAQPIAFSGQMSQPQTDVDMTQTLQAKNPMAVAHSVVAPTLTAANDPSRSPQSSEVTQQVYSVYQSSMAVRRLTPKECERLQGFPDNYTDIQAKGKPTPDGPRYKALGNSMAVPVMAWIGQRIQEVEAICKQNK
jgi:DNA (cytosine-5)-methyltransferase 1